MSGGSDTLEPPAPKVRGRSLKGEPPRDTRAVFLVHGRNGAAANAMHDLLSTMGARVISWSQAHSAATKATRRATPYVLDIVKAGIGMAQAVVVLMTPDDEVRLQTQFAQAGGPESDALQARPNVVLELGMAIALYEDHTILVTIGGQRTISDISGLYQLRMDGTIEMRQYLHDRLKDCHCDVGLQGRWTEAGDFAAVFASLNPTFPKGSAQLEPAEVSGTPKAVGVALRYGLAGIEITNAGTEPIYNVYLEIPADADIKVASPQPIHKLAAGETGSVAVRRYKDLARKRNFDVRVTGRTAGKEFLDQEIFLSLDN